MENNIEVDKEKIIHICCQCREKMELYSNEECNVIDECLSPETLGIIDFDVYKCPFCDEPLWVLRWST